jgi:integrase
VLANGVDLVTVSERLGHSSVRVTAEIYSHAIRGRDRQAADLWDEIKRREGATRQTAKGVN